jgi:CRISPR-associated protein Csd2
MLPRYDFVYLFDVKDGNPNGDPDAGNLPRVDPETSQGLVTDVCLKRKIRNYVGLVKGEQPPFEIYVKEKAVLNNQHARAYSALKIEQDPKKRKSKSAERADEDRKLTAWMCQNFFDVRAFGAVMTTGTNCGQVRGPIQFAFGRSIDPIVASEHAVTRCAVTTEAEAEKQQGDNRTMGRKFTIPYALYRVHGFFNPHLAEQTGFNANGEDLDLFWTALKQMFETDRSASRGEMSPQGLFVFEHESPLGNAPAGKLFDRISIRRKMSNADNGTPPRSFADYEVSIDQQSLPTGIKLHQML